MTDDDIVLAMAICELLEKSVTQKDIENAVDWARKRLNQSRRPPAEAIVTRGGRHD
jgi:hypothetical protein